MMISKLRIPAGFPIWLSWQSVPMWGRWAASCFTPDTDKIQHAGITNLPMGPVHKLQFLRDNKCYYDNRNRGIRNVSAVTAACLMVRREVFEEAGGFCESMQVAFNDVDFCFTLLEKGYYNAVCNHIHLLHHESMSRGADESEEKLKRLHRERTMLYDRHPGLNGKDPFYHDWLNRTGLDTRIQPAYRSGREIADVQAAKEVAKESNEAYVLKNARKDRCLLVRIEAADASHISGYGVVLGSDNACFNGKLLLERKRKTARRVRTGFYGTIPTGSAGKYAGPEKCGTLRFSCEHSGASSRRRIPHRHACHG